MLLSGALEGVPRRIVSLNPSITEFLFVLGVGDRVVATDVWSYRPREAMKTVKVGSFTNADIELINKLKPDLVILAYPVQKHLVERLSAIAPVLAVPMPVNLNAVASIFEMVGNLLDVDEEAMRITGIYMDMLGKSNVDINGVVAVMSLGDFVIPCESSYIASALNKVGLKYVRGLKCVEVITNKEGVLKVIDRAKPNLVIYEGKTKEYRPQEFNWVDKPVVYTPNDTLAHYGPSLPLDLQLLVNTVANKEAFVKNTSSVVKPSLSDAWYKPYIG
ncbi:MAG: helical backbone metal receptor [Vulcanisaeta sp.]|nr:helical backbone metal receptor [Vulcanisaeta sp.]